MNAARLISIGVLARQTGCTVPTIRYYEEIGLLPSAPRTDGGRRVYGDAAARRLTFIRRCRDFGFSIDQVRELVGLVDQPDRPCTAVRQVAARHLTQLRDKLADLQALERTMAAFVVSCDTACAGGASFDCTILEDLSSGPAAAISASQPAGAGCCAAAPMSAGQEDCAPRARR